MEGDEQVSLGNPVLTFSSRVSEGELFFGGSREDAGGILSGTS